jgi:hypothetical protein
MQRLNTPPNLPHFPILHSTDIAPS